jgi:hypothetical protein
LKLEKTKIIDKELDELRGKCLQEPMVVKQEAVDQEPVVQEPVEHENIIYIKKKNKKPKCS